MIGVDLGETGVTVELFDLGMASLATLDRPLTPASPDPAEVAEVVAAGVRDVLDKAGAAESDALGVGLGVPGTVEQAETLRVYAPTIGWNGVALGDTLRAAGLTLPLYVENGAKALGQAFRQKGDLVALCVRGIEIRIEDGSWDVDRPPAPAAT